MATHESLNSLFTDIADAIRDKKGTSDTIVADDFPSEIATIPSGGGGGIVDANSYSETSSKSLSTTKITVYTATYDTEFFTVRVNRSASVSTLPVVGVYVNDRQVSTAQISQNADVTIASNVLLRKDDVVTLNVTSGSNFTGTVKIDSVRINGEIDASSVREMIFKYDITRAEVFDLKNYTHTMASGTSGTVTASSQYFSTIVQSEPSTGNYQSKFTVKRSCVLDIHMFGNGVFYYNNTITTPTDRFVVNVGDTFILKNSSGNAMTFMILVKSLNPDEPVTNIEKIAYAIESGASDSTHVANMNTTTYGRYSSFLSYDSSSRKYTVLKDCALYFIPIVRNYNASSSYPKGEFWYNDARVASYSAGNSSGATAKKTYHRNCIIGDTFYCRTPSSDGWPEQRLYVYLMPNEDTSQKFDEINNITA